MNIYRGDIYFIEDAKYFGVEYQSGTGSRPAVIVSNDKCNMSSDMCTAVYLTTNDDRPDMPTHVPVLCKVPSIARCETVCRINQNRIGEFVRTCTVAEMQAIDNALMIQLGIEPSLATEADIEALKADCKEARNEGKRIRAEAEAMLDIEKNNVKLYMAQLDAQVAANEHLQSLLNEAQEKIDVMTAKIEDDKSADDMTADIQRQLEQVQYIETQNENIRLKAEIDVYKAWLGKLIPQLA